MQLQVYFSHVLNATLDASKFMSDYTRLKIIIAADQYPPSIGGIEKTTQQLATMLHNLGHQVAVIAPSQSLWRTIQTTENSIPTLRVRSFSLGLISPRLRACWFSKGPTTRFLNNFGPDVIQVNNPFLLARQLIRYGRRRSVPVVAGSHVMPEAFLFSLEHLPRVGNLIKKSYWRYVAWCYRGAQVVISPTKTAANRLASVDSHIASEVISNGVKLLSNQPVDDYAVVRRKLKLRNRFTLLYVGRLSIEKKIQLILEAMSRLETHHDLQLVLMGAGNYVKTLKRQVVKLGLTDKVVFVGWISDDEVKGQYLAAADVFVIASAMESQSISTLEAMAAGKPVIAANACALPELVVPGRNGELFVSGDSESLATAIKKMLSDRELIKKYGQASWQAVQPHDITNMPKHYLELYHRLIVDR